MKIRYCLFAALICFTLHSCVVMSPKKYKSILAQRDSLTTLSQNLEDTIARLRADTMRLHHQLQDLQGNYHQLTASYNALNDKYSSLNNNFNASSSRVSELSENLKKREAKLEQLEAALRKRDEASAELKNRLQQALLGFQNSGLSVYVKDGKVYVSLADKLLFPSGSIVINQKGKQALQQLADVLNKEPDIDIAVEGHTDDQKVINLGQIKDNWDLSVLRATSVCRYLTEVEKIDPHRLTATGKSQYQPVDPANTPEARAKNRRIEIVLSPKLDELYNLIKQ